MLERALKALEAVTETSRSKVEDASKTSKNKDRKK